MRCTRDSAGCCKLDGRGPFRFLTGVPVTWSSCCFASDSQLDCIPSWRPISIDSFFIVTHIRSVMMNLVSGGNHLFREGVEERQVLDYSPIAEPEQMCLEQAMRLRMLIVWILHKRRVTNWRLEWRSMIRLFSKWAGIDQRDAQYTNGLIRVLD